MQLMAATAAVVVTATMASMGSNGNIKSNINSTSTIIRQHHAALMEATASA